MSFQPYTSLSAPSLAELRRLGMPPRGYLLSPWLRERDAAMLYAPSGVGKSMVAMTIALAVASGGKVFDWDAQAPRPVLYIDGEMDKADLIERFVDLSQTIAPEVNDDGLSRLRLLARDMHSPEVDFPDIGLTEGQEEVLKFARESQAALVILDNLSTLATVGDENSAADMKKPMELIQKLRQIGCATLLVHHSGKAGSGYRGSSMIETTFAWLLELQRTPNAETGEMDVTLEWRKTRSGKNAATVPKRLRLHSGPEGTHWEHGEPEGLQAQKLAKAIRSCRFGNLTDAAKALGLGKTRGYEVFRQAVALGIIDDREAKRCYEGAKQAKAAEETAEDF